MKFLSKGIVTATIEEAIKSRKKLAVQYIHKDDNELVSHIIAPFDIGTTNPKTQAQNADNLYAYSFTHYNKKTGAADPKVCAFNINRLIGITDIAEIFDENELARLHFAKSRYDYRVCRFAFLSERDWF